MERITQLLQSYFHFRAAVLRSLVYEQISKSEFFEITGLDGNSKYRRQRNPSLWKPAEIHRLAADLGLGDGTSNRLRELAGAIERLPQAEKKAAFKATQLTDQKLIMRLHNVDSWLPQELDKLHLCCLQKRREAA